MKLIQLQSIVFLVLLICSFTIGASADMTVAVTANVEYTFDELKRVFEQETGVSIKGVIGSSGKLAAQIESGAPFDVFLSADMDSPKKLQQEGLTLEAPKVYAYGTLVIWTMTGLDLTSGMNALVSPRVKKIAIASPKTAPYGHQAVNAVNHYGLYDQIKKKLVYGESIAQVNQFIATQAVDLGITAKSVVMAPQMKGQGQWIEVSQEAYEPIAQGAVILKHAGSGHMDEARKFFEFLFSKKAGEIFRQYGYVLPSEGFE